MIEKTFGRPNEMYSLLSIELLQREIDHYKNRIKYSDVVKEIEEDMNLRKKIKQECIWLLYCQECQVAENLLWEKNLLKSDVEYSYRTVQLEDSLVLSFTPVVKKKQNVFQKLFNKKKN